jgi:hypothetical protein
MWGVSEFIVGMEKRLCSDDDSIIDSFEGICDLVNSPKTVSIATCIQKRHQQLADFPHDMKFSFPPLFAFRMTEKQHKKLITQNVK